MPMFRDAFMFVGFSYGFVMVSSVRGCGVGDNDEWSSEVLVWVW